MTQPSPILSGGNVAQPCVPGEGPDIPTTPRRQPRVQVIGLVHQQPCIKLDSTPSHFPGVAYGEWVYLGRGMGWGPGPDSDTQTGEKAGGGQRTARGGQYS